MSVYIGEAVSSALEEIYQAFMINSELMEQGSVLEGYHRKEYRRMNMEFSN